VSTTEAHAFVASHSPEEVRLEVERALNTRDEDGAALERATCLAELGLVQRLAPWRAGSVVPNVRRAVERLAHGDDEDGATARLALRLGACYARRGRSDDEALRLGRYARTRASAGGLAPDDRAFASEAVNHLDRAIFVPTLECVRDLVEEMDGESVVREARSQLARRNPSFAALLGELAIYRAHAVKRLGPITVPAVEKGLQVFRERLAQGGDRAYADLAVTLARAYVDGAFVDVRARDHVKAVLAHLDDKLDSEVRPKLQAYLEEDAFDIPDDHLYAVAKSFASGQPLDLRFEVAVRTSKGNFAVARRLCEMELVRRFDPWYLGDPTTNVARAVMRCGSGVAKLDEHARWVACSLAALYAATLEGATHARALVAAVLRNEPDSPDLKAALVQAGLDPDVPAEELLRLYEDATDPLAHIERFKALAEASGLGEKEKAAGHEVLEWLAAEKLESEASGGVAYMKRRIGDLVEVVVPESITSAATTLIESTLRNVAAESARSLSSPGLLDEGLQLLRLRVGRARILRQLASAGIPTFEEARKADLAALDKIAWTLTHENRILAALEGFGCGLGGATLVLLDLPALVTVNLNAIFVIASVYGFDAEAADECERALALLAGGPAAFQADVEPTVGRVAVRRIPQGALGGRAALALRSIAIRLSGRLAKAKLLQLIPVLGGAVGAGLNFQFTHETTRAAYMLYRYRWIQRRARALRA
jgi:hypothetical protein